MLDKINDFEMTKVYDQISSDTEMTLKKKVNSLFAKPEKVKEVLGNVNGYNEAHVIKIGKNTEGQKIAVDATTGEELVSTGDKAYITRENFDNYLKSTYGLTSKELADKKIVVEFKKGKVVFTDLRKGTKIPDAVLDSIRQNYQKSLAKSYNDALKLQKDEDMRAKEKDLAQKQKEEKDKRIEESFLEMKELLGLLQDKSSLDNSIVNAAEKYIGFRESDGSSRIFTGGKYESKWCAYFVSYVARECGIENFNFSRVDDIKKWGENNNSFHKEPEIGDIIIFKGRNKQGKLVSHTGIVYEIKDGIVKTIEGNTSNKVAKRLYSLNDSRITGYVSLS